MAGDRRRAKGGQVALSERQEAVCRRAPADYSDLRPVFLSCTLKPSPLVANTEGLARLSIEHR